MAAHLRKITDLGVVADRRAFVAHIVGDDGSLGSVTFTGPSVPGLGPIVMTLDSGLSCAVLGPERFGRTFGRAWVKSFCQSPLEEEK